MNIEPIKNQRDYRHALKEIEGLMIAKPNTPEGDRLDVLVTLVEAWERKHYHVDLPDPVEAIKYHMEQNDLQPRDLIPFIGNRNRVHENSEPPPAIDAQNDPTSPSRFGNTGGIADQEPCGLTEA